MCLATNGFRGPGKPYNTALARYRVKAGVKTLYWFQPDLVNSDALWNEFKIYTSLINLEVVKYCVIS